MKDNQVITYTAIVALVAIVALIVIAVAAPLPNRDRSRGTSDIAGYAITVGKVSDFEMYQGSSPGAFQFTSEDILGISYQNYYYITLPGIACTEPTDKGFSPVTPSYAIARNLKNFDALYLPDPSGKVIQEYVCSRSGMSRVLVSCSCGADYSVIDDEKVYFCKRC